MTKRPYMLNCWNGTIEFEAFQKPKDTDKIVPSNFVELLKKPNQNKDATYKGRIINRHDIPGPSVMEHSTGEDSEVERPFWDGQPVDWEYLAGSSLEDKAWRSKVEATLRGMITGVENFNEAHPTARKRKVDPLWKCLLRHIERINWEIKMRGRVSEVKMYHWTPPAAVIDSDSETESGENEELEVNVIDVSRFSIESDPDDPINDATLETDNGPGDQVVNLPEIETGSQTTLAGTSTEHPSVEEPVDIVDELAGNLDEAELGMCYIRNFNYDFLNLGSQKSRLVFDILGSLRKTIFITIFIMSTSRRDFL